MPPPSPPAAKHRRVALACAAAAALVVLISAFGPPLVAPAGADGNEAPGAPLAFRSITAGGGHTCAIDDDGEVRCWGANAFGELGYGDTDDVGDGLDEMGRNMRLVDVGPGLTATAIAAGDDHTCALLDDGSVKCWGNNGRGRLGIGDTFHRGDQVGEMGADLLPVDLGPDRTATAITAGGVHTCALLDDGSVKCWGNNASGQLGYGDTLHRGDAPGEMGANLLPVDLGPDRTATAIAAGIAHTCALLDDGSLKCWGDNLYGQLGYGDTFHRGDQVGEMGDGLAPVDLGPGRTATAITAGVFFTCALLDDATTKCWGRNTTGQLGAGDVEHRGDQTGEMGDALLPVDLGGDRSVAAITAGGNHACALLDDGSLRCWGGNSNGQLGYGDIDSRGDAGGEMGDALPAVDIPLLARAVTPPPTPTPDPTPDPTPTVAPDPTPVAEPAPVPLCRGREATIVGGPNRKRIVGTRGDDVIVTRNRGGVTIIGRGGNDIICGSPGRDTIRGGPGNDRIFGLGGNDRIFANAGRDVLHGGPGRDLLHGGPGRDTCNGGPGRDRARACETTRRVR
ncbi:MAG: hypothetical protein ACE367_10945 [Acidimicrobiales bacterium]